MNNLKFYNLRKYKDALINRPTKIEILGESTKEKPNSCTKISLEK